MASAKLWRAVRKEDHATVDLILSTASEADRVDLLNSKTKKGEIIVHTAIQVSSSEVVQTLLKYRELDVDIYDGEYGYTPLIAAIAFGADVHVLQTLLSRSPSLTIRDKTEAANSALHWAAAMNNTSGLDELLKFKKEFRDMLNAHQETPLHTAAKEGQEEAAILLIDRGADVNAKDEQGQGPLHLAVKSRLPNVVVALLETDKIVIPEYLDNEGNSPLHFACQTQQSRVVTLLKDFGFCIELKNFRKMRPIDYVERNQESLQKSLLEKEDARKGRVTRRRAKEEAERDNSEVTEFLHQYGEGTMPQAVQALFDRRFVLLDDDFWGLTDAKLKKIGVSSAEERAGVLQAIQHYIEEQEELEAEEADELLAADRRRQRNRILALLVVVAGIFAVLYAAFKFEVLQNLQKYLNAK